MTSKTKLAALGIAAALALVGCGNASNIEKKKPLDIIDVLPWPRVKLS